MSILTHVNNYMSTYVTIIMLILMLITFNHHQTRLENPPFSQIFVWRFPRLAPDEIQQQLIRQKLGPYQAAAAYAAVAAKSVRLRSGTRQGSAKSDPSGVLFKKNMDNLDKYSKNSQKHNHTIFWDDSILKVTKQKQFSPVL